MTYFPQYQPQTQSFTNALVTFPDNITIGNLTVLNYRFTNQNRINCSGKQTFFNKIKLGWFVFFSTGTQTSQVRKIVGISRLNKRLILDEPFTVNPSDLVLRLINPIPEQDFCLYNDGSLVCYLNGDPVPAGRKIFWQKTEGAPPVIIYGVGGFVISNGDIDTDEGSGGGDGGRTQVWRFRPTTITLAYVEDVLLIDTLEGVNIEVKYNENLLTEGVHYTLDLANNRLLAIPDFEFVDTSDIFITLFYNV